MPGLFPGAETPGRLTEADCLCAVNGPGPAVSNEEVWPGKGCAKYNGNTTNCTEVRAIEDVQMTQDSMG